MSDEMADILVETTAPAGLEGDLSGPRLENFGQRANELAESLSDIALTLRDRLVARLGAEPGRAMALQEVQLTFGLELQTEAGVFIAKTGTKASFQAALTFKAS
jgi:Trypsin-co-occurring domain 1